MKNLYTQNINTAFEDAVGTHGANRERFAHWLEQNNTNWWQVMWRWGWNSGVGRLV